MQNRKRTEIHLMKPLLHGIVSRARIRLLASVATDIVLRNVSGLLVLLIAAVLLERIFGLAIPSALIFPAVFLFAAAAAVETAARAPGRTAAVLALDRALDTHELFTTAVEMESDHGDIPDEIRTRTAASARDCDVRAAIPFSVSTIMAVATLALTAVLLTISGQPEAPALTQRTGNAEPGGKIDQALNSARSRLETARAVEEAVAELESLGIQGLRDAVARGDTEAASKAASAAQDGIDRDAVSDILSRLGRRAPDRELRDSLARGGGKGLGELAGILAGYAAGADVSTLLANQEAIEAAAAAAAVSGSARSTGTEDASLPPDEIASGASPIIDLDSVQPRYRTLVKRYFNP